MKNMIKPFKVLTKYKEVILQECVINAIKEIAKNRNSHQIAIYYKKYAKYPDYITIIKGHQPEDNNNYNFVLHCHTHPDRRTALPSKIDLEILHIGQPEVIVSHDKETNWTDVKIYELINEIQNKLFIKYTSEKVFCKKTILGGLGSKKKKIEVYQNIWNFSKEWQDKFLKLTGVKVTKYKPNMILKIKYEAKKYE